MEENTTEVTLDVLAIIVHAAFGFVIGAVISIALTVLMQLLKRRRKYLRPFSKRLRMPSRVVLPLLGLGIGILLATNSLGPAAGAPWRDVYRHGFIIVLIFMGAFVATALINAFQDSLVLRGKDMEETAHVRRLRTQTQVITRVGVAVVWVCAIAGALLTFEQFRAIGASLLASAGLLSIVAGLAAQSSLANMFAGIQIAFTDAVRVGDIVVVDDHWGTVEEITLTYVVVASWDDRRWLVPSTVFTSKTFESWTRHGRELMGTVEFELDWMIPVEAMRIHLQRIVRDSDLWDGREVSLQVTDATSGNVQLRATVSAATSGDLWDLRCYVREELIAWTQRNADYALPRFRMEPRPTSAPTAEVRDEFVDEAKRAWEIERAEDATQVLKPSVVDTDPSTSNDALRRSWFRSMWDRRQPERTAESEAARKQELDEMLSGIVRQSSQLQVRTLNEPPDTQTLPRVEVTDGDGSSMSATARLYSGTPEREERARRYSGPDQEVLEERERRIGTGEGDEG